MEPILQFTTRDRNKIAIQGALPVDRVIIDYRREFIDRLIDKTKYIFI